MNVRPVRSRRTAWPRRRSSSSRAERQRGQPVALGEADVRALRAPVRLLHRAEQLILEPVGGALVELLVGDAERGERGTELVGGAGEGLEQVPAGVGGGVGHGW